MNSTQPIRYVSLSKVARRYSVSPFTAWRWVHTGIRGHKLRAVKVGGRWRTRWKWCRQFFELLDGRRETQPTRRPHCRITAAEEREARALGIL